MYKVCISLIRANTVEKRIHFESIYPCLVILEALFKPLKMLGPYHQVPHRQGQYRNLLVDLRRLGKRLDVQAELDSSYSPEETSSNKSSTKSTPFHDVPVTGESEVVHPTSRAQYIANSINRHKVVFTIAVVVGIAALALAYWLYDRSSSHAAPIQSIAVLPFVNEAGDPDLDYLTDGMTETLINSLSQVPTLNVKARSSVFRYKGKDISPQTIGKGLGVQAVLNGRLVEHGDDLTLYLSLIDTTTENQIWGKQYNQKLTNLVSLQSQIASDVFDSLKNKLTHADESRITKTYTVNPEAYRLYLQGRYFWNKRTEKDIRKSIEFFNQAVALDPNYALAYTGIADAYSNLSLGFNFAPFRPEKVFPPAKQAALRALQLDENLAEAHVSVGLVKERWDWDFVGAEAEYKRAIEMNPSYAIAFQRYGTFLCSMGRFDEANTQYERGKLIDPLSLVLATDSARLYFLSRRFDQAVQHLKKVLEMDPSFVRAHIYLAITYMEQGKFDEAMAEDNKAFELTGGPKREDGSKRINDTLAIIYAAAGKRTEAEKLIAEMDGQEKEGQYLYTFTRAAVYGELGDKDGAFKYLEEAYTEKSPGMADLKVAPVFDKIRSDQRFSDLTRRVGLP
jgi:TolB-like protein